MLVLLRQDFEDSRIRRVGVGRREIDYVVNVYLGHEPLANESRLINVPLVPYAFTCWAGRGE